MEEEYQDIEGVPADLAEPELFLEDAEEEARDTEDWRDDEF